MASFYESYIGTSNEERDAMLKDMGISDILELFKDIPKNLIFKDKLNIPGPYSEAELTKMFAKIAQKNITSSNTVSFLGGGLRQQYVPAAIEELMRRGELYTSYTPYQPEISQGMLQLLYEFQSMVSEILDMEVVNAGMYDWASAIGEVLLVMGRITKAKKFLLLGPIAPNRLSVAEAYIKHSGFEIEYIEPLNGNVDINKTFEILDDEIRRDNKEKQIAGVYLEVPTYFGTLPDYPSRLVEKVHQAGSLIAVGVDPISLGILSPPGEYDVDFAVGEGQLLGNSPSSGGPLLGILATKYDKKWVRQIPGRLIGKTKELESSLAGYCITLQTREQHIRREKATSNICTNESITAVNAAIYMAALGKKGFVELSQILTDKAHYLSNRLNEINGVIAPLYGPILYDFLVKFENITHEELERKCLEKGFVPGTKIEIEGCIRLFGVSEMQTKEDIDKFILVIKEIMK